MRLRTGANGAGSASAGHLGPPFPGVKDRLRGSQVGLGKAAIRSACSTEPRKSLGSAILNPKHSMRALFEVIDIALELYIWIVIAMAIFSWLVAFNVVNTRNQVVAMIGDFLYRITEPALRPIRNMMPNLGGIDISPVILFLIIIFIQTRDRALHHAQRLLSAIAAARVLIRAAWTQCLMRSRSTCRISGG